MKKGIIFVFFVIIGIIVNGNSINVNGYVIRQSDSDSSAEHLFTLPDTTILEGQYMVIGRDCTQSEFETYWGVSLSPDVIYINSAGAIPQINGNETYELKNNSGVRIDSTEFIMSINRSFSRDSTNVNTWTIVDDTLATPGTNANGGFNKGLLINEVSDAGGVGNYIYEFIELFNDSAVGTRVKQLFNTPQTPDSSETVLITCYFNTDTIINYCNLIYTSDDFSTTDTVSMGLIDDTTYTYTIPKYPSGSHIKYYVVLNDQKARTVIYPDNAPTSYNEYYVPSWSNFFEVHFNKTVDNSIYQQYLAEGEDSLDFYMAKYIGAATKSISACLYDLDRQIVADSLIAAHNRGINVRFITDVDNRANLQVQQLESAGIPVIDDSFPISYGGSNIMHNKFVVIDSQIVFSGSYNVTDNGTDKNANNSIIIKDIFLANNYSKEFDEMWGSSTMTPDANNSKFSTSKLDNIQHTYIIDNDTIEAYMSPSDGVASKIVNAIGSANKSIYFCIFSYTRQDIADAMKDRYDNYGVIVRGVFDATYWNADYSKSLDLRGLFNSTSSNNPWSPAADVFADSVNGNLLHHKYMLIDVDDWQSNPIVITGSYNWSNNAETGNDENLLIIHSTYFADLFLQEFAARYHEAGGTGTFTVDTDLKNINVNIYRDGVNVIIDYSLNAPCVNRVSIKNNNIEVFQSFNQKDRFVHNNINGGEYEIWGTTNANTHILLARISIDKYNTGLSIVSRNKLFNNHRKYTAKIHGNGIIDISIYNINGQRIFMKKLNIQNETYFTLDKKLPMGVYYIEYKKDNTLIKEKILKIE